MTRETKVGLVVTASFLSLIGGVLAVKYVQNRPDATPKSAEQKQIAQAGAAAGDQVPLPPATTNPEEPPQKLPEEPGKLEPPPGTTLSPPGGLSLPPTTTPTAGPNPKNSAGSHEDPDKDDDFNSPIKRAGHAEEEKKTPPPPPDPPTPTLPAPMSSTPMNSSPPALELPKTGASEPPPMLSGGKLELPMSPPETGSKPAPPPGLSLAPLPDRTAPDNAKEPPKPAKSGDNPNDLKLSPMIEPPPPPPMPKAGNKPAIELPKPMDLPKTGDPMSKPMMDLPRIGDNSPKPTLDPPKSGDNTPKPLDLPKTGDPMPIPKTTLDPPKTGDMNPKPMLDLPKPGGSGGPKPPADLPKPSGPMPPQDFGTGGARLDPSGARPLDNQPEPPVNSYEEEWHYCKQQGETLDSISQKYYFTPKYEQALRQYNLDRNPAPVFQQEKPALSVGQVVKVPPARILERLYPTSVRGGGSAAPAPVSPTAIPTGSKNPAASLGPVAAKDLGGPNEYTVPHEGMTLKDVARDALGNESQWHRIFLLNRWVNPSAPLPTGAKLFLPRAGTQ